MNPYTPLPAAGGPLWVLSLARALELTEWQLVRRAIGGKWVRLLIPFAASKWKQVATLPQIDPGFTLETLIVIQTENYDD